MTPEPVRWDPAQYDRYADERGRPFEELVRRVRLDAPSRVVDIGCGPGSLTGSLAQRWPGAHVTGVDSSADMVEAASAHAIAGRLDFVRADLREWAPDGPVDLVIGNAVLQWVPGHLDLLATLTGWLAPHGVLAFQVPDNFTEPSHIVIRDLRLSPRWVDRLGADADRTLGVERPETYLSALAELGLAPDVWQTTYLQVLTGDDPVLEWVKGTALRPVLALLADDPAATQEFLDECRSALLEEYPPGPYGTVFPFRRTFAVARRG